MFHTYVQSVRQEVWKGFGVNLEGDKSPVAFQRKHALGRGRVSAKSLR